MRVAALCDPSDDSFIVSVLREAGHAVRVLEAGDAVDHVDADVIVARVDEATRRGWLDPRKELPARLVLTSRIDALLEPHRRRGRAVLREPCTAADVLRVCVDQVPAPNAPVDFDWSAHGRRVATHVSPGAMGDAQIDAMARLAAAGVRAPMALVTVVGTEEQRFLAQHGLPDDLRLAEGTPRTWSFCQHVVTSSAPLVIEDARSEESFASTPLVTLGLVRAYAGVPIHVDGAGTIGSVCVLSAEPRKFSAHEIATLELAARAVELRLAALRAEPIELDPENLESHVSEARPPAPVPPRRPPPLPLPVRPTVPSSSLFEAAVKADPSGVGVGTVLNGKYVITARLGKGGMAEVYLARDADLGRLVAVKVLADTLDDRLLLHEARQLSRIHHPSIVQLFEWGRVEGGRPYLVLEYVRGEAIKDVVRALTRADRAMSVAKVLGVLRNLAGALETLHGAGLVHGDVKPGNVILDASLDRAVLIDFGIAYGGGHPGDLRIHGGTPGYCAPEQLAENAGEPSPALDVYALGALAYMMLGGRGPFGRVPADERLAAQQAGRFEPLSALCPSRGDAADAILARALSPDPSARHGTVTELVDALDEALAAGKRHARSISTQSLVAVVPGDDTRPRTRGVVLANVRSVMQQLLGADVEAACFATLSAAHAAILADAASFPAQFYDTQALVAYVAACAHGPLDVAESLGRALAAVTVRTVLPRLQIDRSPYTLVRAVESVHHRYHTWGRFTFTRRSSDSARLELALPPSLAPWMCRFIGGNLVESVSQARPRVRVVHSACVADGAPACRLDVDWSAA